MHLQIVEVFAVKILFCHFDQQAYSDIDVDILIQQIGLLEHCIHLLCGVYVYVHFADQALHIEEDLFVLFAALLQGALEHEALL